MKCDELISDYCFDATDNQTKAVYPKADVDAAIAELKAENQRLKKCEIWMMQHFYCEEVIACESAKNRKLKRALWMARADRAKAIKWHEGLERYLQERKKYWPSRFSFMKDDEMYHVWYKCWREVERKCLKKAEKYK